MKGSGMLTGDEDAADVEPDVVRLAHHARLVKWRHACDSKTIALALVRWPRRSSK